MDTLLLPDEVAKILRVSPHTLAAQRSTGSATVPWLKVGRAVRYSRQTLDAWLRECARSTTERAA